MTFNFLGPGLTVNVEAKVKEQIILDSSGVLCMIVHEELLLISFDCSSKKHIWSHPRGLTPQRGSVSNFVSALNSYLWNPCSCQAL